MINFVFKWLNNEFLNIFSQKNEYTKLIAKDKKSVIILILVGVHKVPFLLEPPTYVDSDNHYMLQ